MFKILFFLLTCQILKINSIPIEKNPEEGDFFEGDIAGVEIIKGAAQIPTKSRVKWPNGIVPYKIDDVYNQANKDIIKSGLKLIEDSTRLNGKDCIRFVPQTIEPTYISIFSDSGCYSYVGKQVNEGAQMLSLEIPGCMVAGIVAHEFIHALGFWHEQSRSDRDENIEIKYENIREGTENNFNKYSVNQTDALGMPYDFGSIMHYGEKSFSKNGLPTILPRNSSAIIGQRKALSEIDVAELRKFYEC